MDKKVIGVIAIFLLLVAVVLNEAWSWVFCCHSVENGENLVLMYKGPLVGSSTSAPDGRFAEVDDNGKPLQSGFLRKMLGPGRHFISPLYYKVTTISDIIIESGEIGIVTSKLGTDSKEFLIDGTVDDVTSKGVLRKPLTPGRYRINLYGFDVTVYNNKGQLKATHTFSGKQTPIEFKSVVDKTTNNDKIEVTSDKRSGWLTIPAGYVGVVTNLAADGKTTAGVQQNVLQPGTYAINPYSQQVNIVEIGYKSTTIKADLQLHNNKPKLDDNGEPLINGNGGIKFPSNDGFPITLDFTLIWGIMPNQAHKVISEFGNVDLLETGLISPEIKSICRLHGSQMTAVGLLNSKSRETFQNGISKEFDDLLKSKNISLQVGLVRHIHIPPSIRMPLQKANIADEQKLTREVEIVTATVEGLLEKAKAEVTKAEKTVIADTARQYNEMLAEGKRQVEVMKADTDRQVAELDLKTAELDAQTTITIGTATAQITKLKAETDALKLQLSIDAFGDVTAYNKYQFAKNLPDNITINTIYSGVGTLWTDIKSLNNLEAARKIMTEQIKEVK